MPTQEYLCGSRKFIGREHELADMNAMLARVQEGRPLPSNLIEYYGPAGIGKSELVKEVGHRALQSGYRVAVADLGEGNHDLYMHNPAILWQGVLGQLGLANDQFNSNFLALTNSLIPNEGIVGAYANLPQEYRLYRRPDWLTKFRDTAVELIRSVNMADGGKLLIVDQTDRSSIELLDFTEEWMINPVLQAKNVAAIWTSRRPWRWKRAEVRRRLTSEEVGCLNLDETRQFMEGYDIGVSVHEIYGVTRGHPGALQAILKPGQGSMAEKIYQNFIEPYVMRDLEDNAMKLIIFPLSCVRDYSPQMMKMLMQTIYPKIFASWEIKDFADYIPKFGRSSHIVWDRGHAIEPTTRLLLSNYYKFRHPDYYEKANKAAMDLYEDWLTRRLDIRSMIVVEELYHAAVLHYPSATLSSMLGHRLEEYPRFYIDKHDRFEDLTRLREYLTTDKELKEMTDNMPELVQMVDKTIGRINS